MEEGTGLPQVNPTAGRGLGQTGGSGSDSGECAAAAMLCDTV